MSERRKRVGMAAALAVAGVVAFAALPAGATTLMRAGLDDLTAANSTIVVGEVLDVHSYWNADGTFILTDVTIAADEVVKGEASAKELTVTLLGGTVGDITTLIVGGPELIPGSSYVLFLNEENLPGAANVRTVRDLCQGVYDVVLGDGGLRAVSQANRHPLVPDAKGYVDAPGGVEGMPFDAMMQSIREHLDRPQGAPRR